MTTRPAMKAGATICSATQTVVPWSVLPAQVRNPRSWPLIYPLLSLSPASQVAQGRAAYAGLGAPPPLFTVRGWPAFVPSSEANRATSQAARGWRASLQCQHTPACDCGCACTLTNYRPWRGLQRAARARPLVRCLPSYRNRRCSLNFKPTQCSPTPLCLCLCPGGIHEGGGR